LVRKLFYFSKKMFIFNIAPKQKRTRKK
jgi:hypothetical protein